jgi:hypothetical protein
MNKSNTLWILATCVVVIGVIIYIANGINNATYSNSTYVSNRSNVASYQQNSNESVSSISAIQVFYYELIESNKVTADEIGDFDTFSSTIKNSGITGINKLYRSLMSKGFTEKEIGTLDGFLTRVEKLRVSTPTANLSKPIKSSNNEYNTHKESPYKGNQLTNGSSPLDACFGKGIYSGNATLTIKNGSSSDAIVCLYSISRERTIRNEYVQKNSSFTMDNIAQGYYKIRVFYGNDWNPTLENSCNTKGNFESDVSFSEFDGQEYFEDSYDGYTVATITLYTVAGGNASTSRISQSDFFNN